MRENYDYSDRDNVTHREILLPSQLAGTPTTTGLAIARPSETQRKTPTAPTPAPAACDEVDNSHKKRIRDHDYGL